MKQVLIYAPSATSGIVMEVRDSVNNNHTEIVPLTGNLSRVSFIKHRKSVSYPVHPAIESGYYLMLELASGANYKINLSEIETPVTIPSPLTGNWINSEAGAALAVQEISNFA